MVAMSITRECFATITMRTYKIKVKTDCFWKQRTKKQKNHENRRFGLIKSLHMQHRSLRDCMRP